MITPTFQGIPPEVEAKLANGLAGLEQNLEAQQGLIDSLCSDFGIQLHLLVQRAFQLKLISYTPFSNLLLSHRYDGWRSDEVNFLIANASMSRKVLGRLLCRTPMAVNRKFHEFRLTKGSMPYEWSPADIRYLEANVNASKLPDLAYSLRRSPIDIKHKSIELGLNSNYLATQQYKVA